jgi:hypothetical protein
MNLTKLHWLLLSVIATQHLKGMTKMRIKISKNNSVLEQVKLNDHSALEIIDNFAKDTIRVLSKEFLENKSTEWVSILPKVIEHYNNTPHTS